MQLITQSIRVTMQINVLRNIAEAEQISESWNQLLSCCSASHVPFLRFEYMRTWWETLGGGEWPQGELSILTAARSDGELVGIAPLFRTLNRQDQPALMLLGSIEISDYLDFIVSPTDLPEFVRAMLEFLPNLQDPDWRVLDLYNLPDTSPTLNALETSAQELGWSFHQERLQPCPYIPLPGDWEEYLSQIDKKQRHEIRRKMRRADEYQPPVRWYIVEDEQTLDREIDDFLALMAQDPEKGRFLTEVMRSQMRASVHTAFQAGWLQLAFLEVGGDKAAGYLNFDFAGHIWVYNSGFAFEYRDLSAGWVLLGHLLKWANENGRKSFDFMRGAEDYKYRFGGIDRYVMRATLEPPQ
jgi:CelD/BcsL family acetyltransferase involved in cellulose biosynthesis